MKQVYHLQLIILEIIICLGLSAFSSSVDGGDEITFDGISCLTDDPVKTITKISDTLDIDGNLDEAAWSAACIIDDFRQVEPLENGEPTEQTIIKLMYNDEYLYIAFICLDSQPDLIQATQMVREGSLAADDRISFVLDTFYDRRNAYFFEINPVGARGDALIEDSTKFRKDWDGIWYGKTQITDVGWQAEIAIPFQTLNFDPTAERWSFNASRFIRRKNEDLRWAHPSQNSSLNSIADAGVLEGFNGIKQGLGIDFKPYGLSTLKHDYTRDRDGLDLDGGFDLFYKPSPSMTMALTFNTDFAETEVDDRTVNLTRFPLFFPEKRDFFLQDAGIFNFGGIQNNPLPFHSRRIGINSSGQAVDILTGLKLTGRTGDFSYGLIDVQMKNNDELGDKNYLIARGSLNVLEQSTVGAIFTYGDPSSRNENYIAGLDFNFRDINFLDDKTLDGRAWVLQSNSSYIDQGQTAYGFKLGYPNDIVNWSMGYSQIDENFNAALGFVPRRGIREYFANWKYRIRPDNEQNKIRLTDNHVGWYLVTNLNDEVETSTLSFDPLSIYFENGDRLSFSYEFQREVLDNSFEIHNGIVIPAGDHRYERYAVQVNTSESRPVNVGFEYDGGGFFTGDRDDYAFTIDWRLSHNLQLGAGYEMNNISLPEGDFITRQIKGRVNIYFTPDISWSTFAQYDNVSETMGLNSRLRWIIKPGNEFYVVLNQTYERNERFDLSISNSDLTTKIGWTFRF